MPKSRVLMISKACVVGIYQRKLEQIAAQDIELMTVVPPSWKDERGEMLLERSYTQGYCLKVLPIALNGSFHLHFYRGLRQVMSAFRPDIVHIDEEPYNLSAWQALFHARRLGAKSLFFSWQNLRRSYPPPFSWGEGWVLKNTDYALVGTDSAAEIWRAKGYRGPISVIPQFGTDPDLFKPAPTNTERPFTIGYIGRLVEEKGVHLLLQAFAQLPTESQLRILGGGPQRAHLQALATQLGVSERVIFDDQIPSREIPPYYHQLDVLALPSLTRPNWKEQFGRVLVEAMASGVPVVGSDSGAIPGVIGDGGLVVAEGDVRGLADALRRLLEDVELRRTLATQGRARVIHHFSQSQIAEQTVQIYRQMMKR